MDIRITSDIERVVARLDAARRQIPFAAAQAATALARQVQAAEKAAIPEVFNSPNAFTRNAVASIGATKAVPVARVFVKDRQAAYLEPSEVHGLQVLGAGKRIKTPVDIRTNASGDIPKGALAKLIPNGLRSTKGPNGYFIGTVRGVNALWQRGGRGGRRNGGYGTKGKHQTGAGFATTLKLLVAFTRPVAVQSDFGFQKRGREIIGRNAVQALSDALERAMQTAK